MCSVTPLFFLVEMQATGVQAGWQMNIKPSITLLVCEIGIWHPNIHLPLFARREAMTRAKELTKYS
jgi:hypothetical protein